MAPDETLSAEGYMENPGSISSERPWRKYKIRSIVITINVAISVFLLYVPYFLQHRQAKARELTERIDSYLSQIHATIDKDPRFRYVVINGHGSWEMCLRQDGVGSSSKDTIFDTIWVCGSVASSADLQALYQILKSTPPPAQIDFSVEVTHPELHGMLKRLNEQQQSGATMPATTPSTSTSR